MTDSRETNNDRIRGNKELKTQWRQTITVSGEINNYRLRGDKQ